MVVGVAHAGGGELGEDRFDGRPRFGVQQPGDAAHPVGLLRPERTVRLRARSTSSGSGPSWSIAVASFFGGLAQLLRAGAGPDLHQRLLRELPHLRVHPAGQLVEERPDLGDVLRARSPRALARPRSGPASGSNGSPFSAVRGPRSSASQIRRRTSLPEIRNRWVSTLPNDLAPNSTGEASRCRRAITRCPTVGSCQVTVSSSPSSSTSSRWVNWSQSRSTSSATAARYRRDCCGDPIRTHTRTLVRPTDKKPGSVTPETEVTQEDWTVPNSLRGGHSHSPAESFPGWHRGFDDRASVRKLRRPPGVSPADTHARAEGRGRGKGCLARGAAGVRTSGTPATWARRRSTTTPAATSAHGRARWRPP